MISLYLTPDKTQLVKAKLKKNGILDVEMTKELPSFWSGLAGNDESIPGISDMAYASSRNLSSLFKNVRKVTSTKYEEVYIVLPDILFAAVNCYAFVSEEMLKNQVKDSLGVDSFDDFYIVEPFETRAPFAPHKTVYAIRRKYIDRIIDASKSENVSLISVEPASLSFVRARGEWQIDYPMIEMFNDESTIVMHSPVGGVFRVDAPHMGIKELLSNENEADGILQKNCSVATFTGGQIFQSFTPDTTFIFLADNPKVKEIVFVKHNEPAEPVKLSQVVETDIPLKKQVSWMCVIGTLLQSAIEDSDLYEGKHPSTIIKDGNLLPTEMQSVARNRQWAKIARRTLQGVAAVLLAVLATEVAGVVYYSSVRIDPALQREYDKANSEMKVVDAEINAIKTATKLDSRVMEAYDLVMQSKPEKVFFTDIVIGNPQGMKDKDKKYVLIKAVSADEMSFNDFISKLQDQSFFLSPSVNSIKNDSNGVRTADISIGKGGGKK